MKKSTLIAVSTIIACCVVGQAKAQIVPIDAFAGDHSEGFEGLPFGVFSSHPVFDNTGIVQTIDGSNSLIISSGWSFMGVVSPHSGQRFMGSASALPEWVFDVPALRFGGFFTTNSGTDDAVAHFYDVDNNLLASLAVTAPANTNWVWNGWEVSGGPGIARVVIDGNNPFGGGFIMHDDMQYTAIPAPGVLGLFAIGLGMARRRRRTV